MRQFHFTLYKKNWKINKTLSYKCHDYVFYVCFSSTWGALDESERHRHLSPGKSHIHVASAEHLALLVPVIFLITDYTHRYHFY